MPRAVREGRGGSQAAQGVVKAALGRVREGAAARARELGDEALALQERLDAGRHTAAERAEDAGALSEQARAAPAAPGL